MDSKETKKWYYVLPVVSIGIFILAWVWLSSAENSMIPTPLATWEKFLNIMTNPISQAILPVHIWVSLRRVLIAFFFAIVLGVGLGVGLGWSKTFNAVVDPIFEMLRPIRQSHGFRLSSYGLELVRHQRSSLYLLVHLFRLF